jgi:Putative regulator of cell autolysis
LKLNVVIPYDDFFHGLRSFTYNFIPILLLVILNILIIFKLPQHALISQHLPLKIATDLFLSFFILFVINQLFLLVASIFNPNLKVDHVGTILSNILIFLCVEIVYYIISSRESIKRVEAARREAIQYQYDALKAQVNPHFLFNSLNILYSLTMIDMEKSRQFIMSLSQMYRYIMSQHESERVSLSEELSFLQAYVDVLKIRYHDCFSVSIIGEEHVAKQEIIPYCMQLVMENVTKHNVIQPDMPMEVKIEITPEHIAVSNPIYPKRAQSSSGIGLRYITELYRLQGRQFRHSNDGKTFITYIPYL